MTIFNRYGLMTDAIAWVVGQQISFLTTARIVKRTEEEEKNLKELRRIRRQIPYGSDYRV